jgi:hypothetical protein
VIRPATIVRHATARLAEHDQLVSLIASAYERTEDRDDEVGAAEVCRLVADFLDRDVSWAVYRLMYPAARDAGFGRIHKSGESRRFRFMRRRAT